MARSNVIRLCVSLAAIPVLFALGALTIPDAHAQSRKAPRATPLPAGRAVLTATTPIAISSAFSDPENVWAEEPVQNPSIAVGPDGTAHFAWYAATNIFPNPCDGPVGPGNPGNVVFYAYLTPMAHSAVVDDPIFYRSQPRLGIGQDNTLFIAWQKCNSTTGKYHPAFDWASSGAWLDPPGASPFTFTTSHETENPLDPLNSRRYVDDAEAPFPFISQEGGQSRLHLIWERYDTLAPPDAAPQLYYARPVTDDKPITDPRNPDDPRLRTTNVSIADYAGQSPSMAVFENEGNLEAHVVWQSQLPDCEMFEIEWGYAPNLPPTLTTAEPGTLPLTWAPSHPISYNGAAKRAAKGLASCGSVTRTAIHPVTAMGPDATMYAAWAEGTPDGSAYDIMAAHLVRDSIGPSWDKPMTVTTATRTFIVSPATAVDKRGRQYVLWNEGFDKVQLKGMDANGEWTTAPIQLNRGPDCAGTPNASGERVRDVGLTYDPVGDRLHAIWLATTPTSSAAGRLCYASVDVSPPYHTYLPLISQAATPHLGAAKLSGIRPLARP